MSKKSAVLHFIEEERAKGTSDQAIRHKLLDAGWHMDIIHRVMDKDEPQRPHSPTTPKVNRLQAFQLSTPIILGVAFVILMLLIAFI